MKKSNLLAVMCACALSTGSLSVHAGASSISGQGTWGTTLKARDLDGNKNTVEAYYDTTLNVTWLANANFSGAPTDWATANSWAANLNPYSSGITGWRLPTITDTGSPGCDFAYTGTDCGYNVDTITGELASMYYDTLGNTPFFDTSGNGPQPGWGFSYLNAGPFSNIFDTNYWTNTEYAPDTTFAWLFSFEAGSQDYFYKSSTSTATVNYYAWAVHDGNIGAAVVPVPAAVWLFGSGLLGLIGISKRNKNAA